MSHARSFILCTALVASTPAWAGNPDHPATCHGFIGVMQAAAASEDPTGPQAYIDLADKMWVGMNTMATQRRLSALPLPADENSEATRAMVVVRECQANMSLKYAEAATNAYLKLRTAAGLSNAFTAR